MTSRLLNEFYCHPRAVFAQRAKDLILLICRNMAKIKSKSINHDDHDDLDEKQQVLQNNYSLGVTLGVHLCAIGAFESFSCHPRADLRRGTLAFYCLCEQSAAVLRWVIVLRQRSKMH